MGPQFMLTQTSLLFVDREPEEGESQGLQAVLASTDGVISPQGPQGARSYAGVRLSRVLWDLRVPFAHQAPAI